MLGWSLGALTQLRDLTLVYFNTGATLALLKSLPPNAPLERLSLHFCATPQDVLDEYLDSFLDRCMLLKTVVIRGVGGTGLTDEGLFDGLPLMCSRDNVVFEFVDDHRDNIELDPVYSEIWS